MKHWLLKFISCVLTIAVFFSTIELFPQVTAYASGYHPDDWGCGNAAPLDFVKIFLRNRIISS